jgi:hypothetical protein
MSNVITLTAPNAELLSFANAVVTLAENGRLDILTDAIADKAKPVQAKPVTVNRADVTTADNHEYIRMVACELALMDIGRTDVVDGYSLIENVPTIADVRERYSMLRNYAKSVKGLEFGRNSALYAEAAALVA